VLEARKSWIGRSKKPCINTDPTKDGRSFEVLSNVLQKLSNSIVLLPIVFPHLATGRKQKGTKSVGCNAIIEFYIHYNKMKMEAR